MAGKKRIAVFPEATAPLLKRIRLDSSEHETRSSSSEPRAFTGEANSIAETATPSRSASRRPKKYECQYEGCDKAFDRPVRLEAHVRTHTDDRPFACKEDECDKRFFKPEHLKAHVQNKHSDETNYTCTYVLSVSDSGGKVECGKSFTTGTRLRRHITAHEQKEQTTCLEAGCGQVFRKLETLQLHIKREHLKESAFRCTALVASDLEDGEGREEDCGQTFSTASQLKGHERREHASPRYFCELCSSNSPSQDTEANCEDDIAAAVAEMKSPGFLTYADLQAHIKAVHPPTCSICSKRLPSNKALVAHMDIVHGTQPLSERQKFACSHPNCSRAFTRMGNLKVHIQNVHVQNKKFVCGVFDLNGSDKVPDWDGHGCGMGFGTKANLESHVRTQHLDLLDIQHPRRKMKVKMEEDDYPTPLLTAADTPSFLSAPATPGNSQPTISMLTGQGYASSRHHACWTDGCELRFVREYDLAQHMEIVHGWNIDDINDRFVELAALQGEDFWVGGEEALEEHTALDQNEVGAGGSMLDHGDKNDYGSFVHDANFGLLGNEKSQQKADASTGMFLQETFKEEEEDNFVVDPALVEL